MREVLATEMLEALGVDTSKSFSLIETGEALERGDEPSPTRSVGAGPALAIRIIRIGTFQRLLYHDRHADIGKLLDYAVGTYMPAIWTDDPAERALAFLAESAGAWRATGAQWIAAGFVHGVLNTDNINVTGESFDYGPWRFAPVYDPVFTAAYFDESGLYAFGRQPDTLVWNLARLAECLLPLAPKERLEQTLRGFEAHFRQAFEARLLARLGLAPADADAAAELARRGCGGFSWRRTRPSSASSSTGAAAWRARIAPSAVPSAGHYAVRRLRAGAGGAGEIRDRAPTPISNTAISRGRALDHAHRRGRGDLGTDRVRRRLVAVRGEAGGDRRDAAGIRDRTRVGPAGWPGI